MSNWFAVVQQRLRSVLTRLNLNADVGKDVFPERKYRPAPGSQPSPDISINFPVKAENLADRTYATRKPRLAAQAGVKYRELSSKPNEDIRNMYFAPSAEMWPLKFPTRRDIYDLTPFRDGDK
jgi:hypothetical protein